MKLNPYLFLDGRCEEAIEFYRKALGAQVTAMIRNKESPDQSMCMPGSENKILHAAFKIGDADVMASDGRNLGQPKFEGFSLALSAKDKAEAEKLFKALAEGGQEQMPLTQTFFSPAFGMVADRFGVSWMVVADQAAA